MKMKLYATITKSKTLMSFVNLFIRLQFKGSLSSQAKESYFITSHHFGHLRLPCRGFLLITSPNLSSFCRRVPYIQCGILSSPYFYIQKCCEFHYLSLHSTREKLFQSVFSGHNNQFQYVTYGRLFVVL